MRGGIKLKQNARESFHHKLRRNKRLRGRVDRLAIKESK